MRQVFSTSRNTKNYDECFLCPVLTKKHKAKRVKWAKKYLKYDFNEVIWTDECRVTLNGPDGWAKG